MKVLYEIPANLTQFLYNLINISTNVNEKFHVYLIEDGLDLWLVVLENSREMTNELLELSNNLLPIIGKFLLYFYHIFISNVYWLNFFRTIIRKFETGFIHNTCLHLFGSNCFPSAPRQ